MTDRVVDLIEADFPLAGGQWLVEFWATWCGPCQAMQPVLEEFASETPAARVGKVEITQQPALAGQFGISSVPTLILFREGEPVRRMFGAKTKRQLLAAVKQDEVA